jgi:hypothetical protein
MATKVIADRLCRLPCEVVDFTAGQDCDEGQLHPIGCVATPCDEDSTLVMPVRRNSESLIQFPTRLDQAIAKAYNEGVFTDEINPPL